MNGRMIELRFDDNWEVLMTVQNPPGKEERTTPKQKHEDDQSTNMAKF